MIKAFWFFIRIALLVAVLVWVAGQPGYVELDWMDYHVTMKMNLFLGAVIVLFIGVLSIYSIVHGVFRLPKRFGNYQTLRSKDKGYQAITRGLSAVASGDTKAAVKYAYKARHFMPKDNGLPLMLEAQAARLDGREDDAKEHFEAMLEHPDAGFLGVRGLLHKRYDMDQGEAFEIANCALKSHPKQPWLLQTTYELAAHDSRWDYALSMLKRCEKVGVLQSDKGASDRAALYVMKGRVYLDSGHNTNAIKMFKKALSCAPQFVPAALDLIDVCMRENKKRTARNIVKKAWKACPHPDLAKAWRGLIPRSKADNMDARLKWVKTLIDLSPGHALGYRVTAQEAADQSLWGEAKQYLEKSEVIMADKDLYHQWIAIEKKSGGHFDRLDMLQDCLKVAPLSHVWICSKTQRIFHFWQPFSASDQSFNSILWSKPVYENANKRHIDFDQTDAPAFLKQAP